MWLNVNTDAPKIMKINWWPEIAEEFLTRKRVWPEASVLEGMCDSCYLVKNPGEYEFSYSFQNVEEELAEMMSDEQKEINLKFQVKILFLSIFICPILGGPWGFFLKLIISRYN